MTNDEYTDDEMNRRQYERTIRLGAEDVVPNVRYYRAQAKYRNANYME